MKRIRYIKTDRPNVLKSTRNFLGQQDALYKVYLNTEEMRYWITNVRSNLIIRSTEKDGRTPPGTFRTLKDQAKKALKSLSVNFEYEFRDMEKDNE